MAHGTDEAHQGRAPDGTIEPGLADAVADFGGPPVAPAPTESATPAEPPTHHEAAHAEPPAHEPPRRRSTVREPAPLAFDHGTSTLAEPTPPAEPAPVPAVVEPQEQPADDPTKPRRTGWWAKRVLGG
jgi:ribonuclease E